MPDPLEIETFTYAGQTRYKCPLVWESGKKCAYDTYDVGLLRDHMRTAHTYSGKPRQSDNPQPIVSPLLDHRGQRIVRQPIVPPEAPFEFRKVRF